MPFAVNVVNDGLSCVFLYVLIEWTLCCNLFKRNESVGEVNRRHLCELKFQQSVIILLYSR